MNYRYLNLSVALSYLQNFPYSTPETYSKDSL